MATAPHALAVQTGAAVLGAGGNAADAAIAMAASLGVLYPHMTGIGGDLFALYYDSGTGEVVGYNGSGAAAALATLDFYASRGLRAIPERGGPAALTVPGAVDAWFALHERFGKTEMSALLAPAIAFARDGAPIARSLARSIEEDRLLLEGDEGAREAYGRAGRGAGDRLYQPALARTLGAIAARGRDWLYAGDGAASVDAHCRRIASPLRASDFASHRGFWTTPIRIGFRGAQSLTTPPNSQGLALLLAQSIYEESSGSSRAGDCSASLVHTAVEATRLAYEDRDRYVADPHALAAPLDRLLSREYSRARAREIDPNRAGSPTPVVPDLGGTTYFACVDGDGNAASVIQSIYQHFGAAVVVPELGIALHDRGCWFTLDEGAPRSLVPGRRPFHTLIANMLLRDGKPWVVYGSMGGDAQPQTGLALSIRIAERAMDPQAAIEAPRWRWGRSAADGEPEVSIEARAGAACVTGLRARGHRVVVCDDWEETMGHAGAIVVDRERGVLLGGSDPRSDGAAIGE
jgi:gamma-glutamyltranspeptidase